MRTEKLRRLRPGEQFVYVFDLGDDWTHLCTVNPDKIDPLETLGITTSEIRMSMVPACSSTRLSALSPELASMTV